ncbi:ABC transporter ATP-binding protein [Phormidium sp. FACHB-1136]|uniref:ABC transporter ATP-binding protein n=1 Tax=Phormidium sp. FACHB-1136 TaxID=2692848 RepID=UPI001682DBF0|nr:ABC transporter ATP-binding protein [Phormidium sp. FACHB-1136]MBD2429510.1 ABC transporter ATP-binding protein [Phormidium sp. FACHB-1136]
MPLNHAESTSILQDLRQLWLHLSPRRHWQLGLLLVALVLSSFSEMVSVGAIYPFLSALGNAQGLLQEPNLQPVFKLLRIDTPQRLVLIMALGFIGTLGVANGLRLLTLNLRYRLAAAIGADISSQVYYTTIYQPYRFHVKQNSSDLIQTVTGDTGQLTNGVLIPLVDLMANSILAPALILTLILIDWRIALGAALILGTAYIVLFRARQKQLRRNSAIFSQTGRLKVQIVQEGIGGIRDVLLDHSQPFFHSAYQLHEQLLARAQVSNLIIITTPIYIIEFIALGSIALLAVGLGRGGDFSQVVPILGSLALGAKRLVPALQMLFASLSSIQASRVSMARVLVALNRSIDPMLVMSVVEPLGLHRDLRLEGIWFRYGEDGDWILRNFNLKIAAKTSVAFVGSTGSGKSTTADLILGLLQPEKGQIWVDGLPLQGERLPQWQAAVAHVPQQIYLSDSTLTANIAFGVPEQEVNLGQVQRAAKLARIAEFIEGLPAGYDTYVGERGVRLSGGQRQRIGIARALYKQASVIVFDEATSALDNATEREVMAAIEGLSGELTIILIAHRLSTVERCDLVVELSQGRVVAQGSYQELMAQSASFQQMAGVEG